MSLLHSATIDNVVESTVNEPKFVELAAQGKAVTADSLQKIIKDWELIKHNEGGYFKETDRSPFVMDASIDPSNPDETAVVKRNMSTLIYYLLTPDSPVGKIHKNKNRITHILQRGKGQYVLIYPDGKIKSFKVGFDYANGEISQWVVPGGVYKASFLLPNQEFNDGLLISEVVVPGFDFDDHLFMSGYDELVSLVGATNAANLKFLL